VQCENLLNGWWQMGTLLEEVDLYRRVWTTQKLDGYDFVLLLPDENDELSTRIRAAFEQKLKGRRGAVIEGKDAVKLVRLYELYEFSGKVIVGSFDKPYGRKLFNLFDCGIADEQTLINDVILGAL
jgi:hypothetical protein